MQVTTLSTPLRSYFFPSASQAASSNVPDSTKACTNCLSAPAQSVRSTYRHAGSPLISVREPALLPSANHEFSPVSFMNALFGGN